MKVSMNVDRGRNCYSYRGFGYIARNYKNREIVEEGLTMRIMDRII